MKAIDLHRGFKVAALLGAALTIISCATSPNTTKDPVRVFRRPFTPPIIVGHRGAAGYVPEHTLRSYKLALDIGADYIEPDLVVTKDNVLVIRHEPEISQTTNVAEKKEFKKRKTSKVIDGEKMTGWFTEDFTLAELKTLRAKERLPFRSHREDGLYQIVTFEEFLQFVRDEEKKRGKVIGIIPEVKHSSYMHSLGFDPEQSLVDLLKKYNFDNETEPVIIQSFEVNNLKRLSKMTKVELVQLLDDPWLQPGDAIAEGRPEHFSDLAKPEFMKSLREYATWISPDKAYIYPRDKEGNIHEPTHFIADAHHAGLKVLPYTFRVEPQFLPKNVDARTEFKKFFEAGADAVFTDFSDVAVAVRRQLKPLK